MTYIKYEDWRPQKKSKILVNQANVIIDELQDQGYILTLRQLYYQLVGRGLIPNSEPSYISLTNIVARGRLAGLISWDAIEDRNRHHNLFWTEENDSQIIKELPNGVRFDRWSRQDTYVEVWVEKEALGNVVERACAQYVVPHMACKGYMSLSEHWRAANRFKEKIDQGKHCILIHLGDHDPSGVDMTRDNREKLDLLTARFDGVEVKRLSLIMEQVEQYNLPPNPAKTTDPRSTGYIERFGAISWELDALPVQVIESLITEEIEQHIDPKIWREVGEQEAEMKEMLSNVYDNWRSIKKTL